MAHARRMQETLAQFGIEVSLGKITRGPTITRYELKPAPGVKLEKITVLSRQLAAALKAEQIHVLAPIPGTSFVGIEVPNLSRTKVVTPPKNIQAEIKRLAKKFSSRPTRDPARITGVLKVLEQVWRSYPDWRLGQMIVNAARRSRPSFVCPEVFYLEDDEMLKGIEQMLTEQRNLKAKQSPSRSNREN